MYFKQFYLGCLAHASYMIGSEGVAAVVDPQRDVEQYLHEAEANGLAIEYVIETHLHADFVSGHCELAARTGAKIYIGRAAQATFDHVPVADGDEVALGAAKLRFLETPGHTPEGISVLVFDPAGAPEPSMVLTGDTLFIGDVGRPDLAGGRGYTPGQMAGMLYDSLRGKLLALPDSVVVYPAHGAGSACGKNISKETFSTLGEQRRTNYALRDMSRDEFVRLVTADLPPAPAYFPYDADLNRRGARPLEQIPRPRALSPDAFEEEVSRGAAVLDVRRNVEFGAGHVPGSVNIGLKGQFAAWAGSLLDPARPVLVMAASDDEVDEAVTRLARVGIENVTGYLEGGVEAWRASGREIRAIPQIEVAELRAMLERGEPVRVLDVRRPGEYAGGHVPGAASAPLDGFREALPELGDETPVAVICAGGYRSSAATSLLEATARGPVVNVLGGTGAWVGAGYPVER